MKDSRYTTIIPILLLLYIVCFASFISIAGCGGGGGGGGGTTYSSSTSVSLQSFSGDVDPDGDGTALVVYALSFPKDKSVSVAIEFSTDGGSTYRACTEDTSPILGGETNPTQGISQLAAGPGGVTHYFAWDTDAPGDLPGQNLNWVLLRIRVIGGSSDISGFLVVTNDEDDATVPTLTGLTATAVEGPSNDILNISYSEAVEAVEAQNPDNYNVENPVNTSQDLSGVSAVSYDPLTQTATITLNSPDGPNLKFGTGCKVTVSGVHDLMGNEIESGSGDEVTATVDGDGENLPEDQPTLLVAYYVGEDLPERNEFLCLLFDEEVALSSTHVFNNQDVDFLSGSDTIGVNTPIPVALADPRTVQITLGVNPKFTPNMSRINIPDLNDVIYDLAGNKPYMPSPALPLHYELIIYEDTSPPVVEGLTLNGIPEILNGTGPAGGKLLAPRTGFDISMDYIDEGGAGVDPETLMVRCNTNVTYNGNVVPKNENLVPYLVDETLTALQATLRVPNKLKFPEGTVRIEAKVKDLMGNASALASFSFDVIQPTSKIQPFETAVNPSQVWNVLFSRDLYTIDMSGSDFITVNAQMTPNGKADFREDLILFGLNSKDPIAVPGTSKNSNQFIYGMVVDAVLEELQDNIFSGANIVFTDQNQGGIPGNKAQVDYGKFTHSQIAVGGDSDVGALGVAFIDRGNQHQDNDMLYNGSSGYNPGLNLGVFTTRIYKFEVNGSAFSLFRLSFDKFIPGRGSPVGEGANDEAILMELAGTGPAVGNGSAVRRNDIILAVQRLARYIAVLTAHEMGHSMGLSVNGAMPDGLYGGDAMNFPGSTSNHISLTTFPGLFIMPAVNIMIPATNFWYTNSAGTRFNSLNMAYLREKVFYNP